MVIFAKPGSRNGPPVYMGVSLWPRALGPPAFLKDSFVSQRLFRLPSNCLLDNSQANLRALCSEDWRGLTTGSL